MHMRRFSILLATMIFLFHVCASCTKSPEAGLYIEDQPALLTAQEHQRLVETGKAILRDLNIHIKTVILKDHAEDIDHKASEIFSTEALGKKTAGARGILFLIDPKGRQVRLEIGYGLEPLFPDGFIGYLERRQMLPFFRSGQVGPGIEATMELIVGKALGTIDEDRYRIDPVPKKHSQDHYSGGAGARITVGNNSEAPRTERAYRKEEFSPQKSPVRTLEQYRKVLAHHMKDPSLELYTPQTQKFFAEWTVTDAQQDNELRTLESVSGQEKLFCEGDRAVIRFPLNNRQAPPYFFRRINSVWMLDFAGMNSIIGFNHLNQWHFIKTDHPWRFAFSDLHIDKNGSPHAR